MSLFSKRIFIAGIGTDIGKTLVSAILVEALKADYWKPIQAGNLYDSDTIRVKELISNSESRFFEEAYKLTEPMSPHAAAEIDGLLIDKNSIVLPRTENTLIIEAAGGLMVPLNDGHLVIDLITHLETEVILVSKNYLGSINHTLLSVEALKSRNIKIAGIIFNGNQVKSTEDYILNYTGLQCLGRIPELEFVNKEVVKEQADSFLENIQK